MNVDNTNQAAYSGVFKFQIQKIRDRTTMDYRRGFPYCLHYTPIAGDMVEVGFDRLEETIDRLVETDASFVVQVVSDETPLVPTGRHDTNMSAVFLGGKIRWVFPLMGGQCWVPRFFRKYF